MNIHLDNLLMHMNTSLLNQRCDFSLVTRYSLKFTRCSLLVVKSLVSHCKIRSLLVAGVARCKKSLVTRCKKSLITRCRSCSLQKITRYSLQNSLVTRCRSCSLQNSLVTRCRSCSLQKITRSSLQKLLVVKSHWLFVAKFDRYSLRKVTKQSHFQLNLVKDGKI